MRHNLIITANVFAIAVSSVSYANTDRIKHETWSLDNFTDEFGDKTRDRFISHWFSGTFSNTATTASSLRGYVQISKSEGVTISLWEYGNHVVKGWKSDGELYFVYVKAAKQKYTFLGELALGSSRIKLIPPYTLKGYSRPSRYLWLLKKYDRLKIYVSDGDGSSYRFDIDSRSFNKKYRKLGIHSTKMFDKRQ